MSITGNVILTINGQRVREVTDADFAEAPSVMRQATPVLVLKEDAICRWTQFNRLMAWNDRQIARRVLGLDRRPRPTPKQIRLKRRAAGAKRRNKGKR